MKTKKIKYEDYDKMSNEDILEFAKKAHGLSNSTVEGYNKVFNEYSNEEKLLYDIFFYKTKASLCRNALRKGITIKDAKIGEGMDLYQMLKSNL